MALLSILEFPDPRLRTKAKPVTAFGAELERFVADMFETMYAAPGVGLAATQVNVHEQVLVADMSEDKSGALVLVNPRILEKDGVQVFQEGCLSFPGIFADVERALHVKVAAHDLQGREYVRDFEGPLAVCVQHEMDHLLGKVFVEYLSQLKRDRIKTKMLKKLREEERA